jgi:hypothetical protein
MVGLASEEETLAAAIEDVGDAEKLIKNPHYLSKIAHEILQRGVIPDEDG